MLCCQDRISHTCGGPKVLFLCFVTLRLCNDFKAWNGCWWCWVCYCSKQCSLGVKESNSSNRNRLWKASHVRKSSRPSENKSCSFCNVVRKQHDQFGLRLSGIAESCQFEVRKVKPGESNSALSALLIQSLCRIQAVRQACLQLTVCVDGLSNETHRISHWWQNVKEC